MWPAVPVTAWASMFPRASNTAAERSPTSRTMGVKEVRMRAAACSLATAISRLQRISRVTGSRGEPRAGSGAAIELHHQVALAVDPGPAPGTDHCRRLALLDHGWPLDHVAGLEPVAVEHAGLDEAASLLRPASPPALEGRSGERRSRRSHRVARPADPEPPGENPGIYTRRPAAVEPDVCLRERLLQLPARAGRQLLAEGDRQRLALAAMAHVGRDLDPDLIRVHPGPPQLLDPLTPHLVQHPWHRLPGNLTDRLRPAAGEVERRRGGEHAEGRRHPRSRWAQHPADAQRPSHPPGVDRPRSSGGDEGEAPEVAAALDGVHAGSRGHALVDHAMDASRRLLQSEAELGR